MAGRRLQSPLGGMPCIDKQTDADIGDNRAPFQPFPHLPPIFLRCRDPAIANYEYVPHSAAAAAAHQPGRLDRFPKEGFQERIDALFVEIFREAEDHLESELSDSPSRSFFRSRFFILRLRPGQ